MIFEAGCAKLLTVGYQFHFEIGILTWRKASENIDRNPKIGDNKKSVETFLEPATGGKCLL